MGLKVADLFADLSLRSTQFSTGLRGATQVARATGKQMELAFGKGPQAAIEATTRKLARSSRYAGQTYRMVGVQIARVNPKIENAARTAAERVNRTWGASLRATGDAAQATGRKAEQATRKLGATAQASARATQAAARGTKTQVDGMTTGVARAARTVGTSLEGALGTTPQRAVRATKREAKCISTAVGTASRKVGRDLENALGKRPQKAMRATERMAARVSWVVRGHIKDITKVVSGILMAQGFYRLMELIQTNIAEVFRFAGAVERSTVQFGFLLANARAGSAMMQEMLLFAAKTPFTLEEVNRVAKILLATGFGVRDIIPLMTDLADVAAATGGEFANVADILGHIRSEGRMTAITMRRLYALNIPASKILREELGLTHEQIIRIADEMIPAEVAIEALRRGWRKQFGGAAQDIESTMAGVTTTVLDYMRIIAHTAFLPLTNLVRDRLLILRDQLDALLAGIRKQGRRGLFEALIPEKLRITVKAIVGAFVSLAKSLHTIGRALAPVVRAIGEGLLRALSVVLPILAIIVHWLALLLVWVKNNVPHIHLLVGAIIGLKIAAYVAVGLSKLAITIKGLFVAEAAATKLTLLAKAIKWLGLAILAKPLGVIIGIGVAFLALARAIKPVRDLLDQVAGRLAALAGIDLPALLPVEIPEDLSDALDGVVTGLEGVKSGAEAAGQAMKDTFLAAFDEVYAVPDALDAAAAAAAAAIPGAAQPTPAAPPTMAGLRRADTDGLLEEARRGLAKLRAELEEFEMLPPPAPDFWDGFIPPPVLIEKPAFIAQAWARLKGVLAPIVSEVARLIREGLTIPQPAPLLLPKPQLQPFLLPLQELVTVTIPLLLGSAVALLGKWATDAVVPFRTWATNARAEVVKAIANIITTLVGFPAQVAIILTAWVTKATLPFRTWAANIQAEVRGAIAGAITTIVGFPAQVAIILTTWLTNTAELLRRNKPLILAVVAALGLAVVLIFAKIPLGVGTAIAGLVALVVTTFTNTRVAAAAQVDETRTSIVSRWTGIATTLSGIWNGIVTTARTVWNRVTGAIKEALNGIIGLINKVIAAWNELSFTVPRITVAGRTIGGQAIGVPQVGQIPRLRRGGVVREDTIANIGEHGREAVVPLTGADARPFAQVIAGELAAVLLAQGGGRGGGRGAGDAGLPPIYVGTLVADERGLRELERRLQVIRVGEAQRRGEGI